MNRLIVTKMVNISQMYLNIDEPLSDNDNIKKLTHCHNCCKIFMTPPSYKGITPKFCYKCYKNKEQINPKTTNNLINNHNSVNELGSLDEALNSDILPNVNYDNEVINNNLLFYIVLEKLKVVLSLVFKLIPLRFTKSGKIKYLLSKLKMKKRNKINEDKVVPQL